MALQVTTIMLAVADMDRAKKFYEGIGAKIAQDYPKFAKFDLGEGSSLGLYPVEVAGADAGVGTEGSGFKGVSFHYIVESTEEVDEVIAAAVAGGGSVVKEASGAQWGGYFGYFADPDGYLWKAATSA